MKNIHLLITITRREDREEFVQYYTEHNIPVVCKLPIDPSVAAKCDRGAAEEYEGEWLDPMIDFLEKMK